MRYALLLVAALAAGCTTPSYTRVTRYYLETGGANTAAASPSGKSLGIRTLLAARPYDQKVAYRMPDYTLGGDETIQWAESPRDTVTRALADALAASGRFKDVGNAADIALPDWTLTGEVRRFDENRTRNPWTADCEIRLELRETQSGEALWAGTLLASVPMDRNENSALPAAMSKAISEVVAQAVKAITEK